MEATCTGLRSIDTMTPILKIKFGATTTNNSNQSLTRRPWVQFSMLVNPHLVVNPIQDRHVYFLFTREACSKHISLYSILLTSPPAC